MEFKAKNLEAMTKVVNVDRSEGRSGPWETQYLERKKDEEEPGKGQRRSHLSKRRKTRRVYDVLEVQGKKGTGERRELAAMSNACLRSDGQGQNY